MYPRQGRPRGGGRPRGKKGWAPGGGLKRRAGEGASAFPFASAIKAATLKAAHLREGWRGAAASDGEAGAEPPSSPTPTPDEEGRDMALANGG